MLCAGVVLVRGCRSASCYFDADCCRFFFFSCDPLLQSFFFFFFFESIHELVLGFGSQDAGSQQIGFLLGSCGVTLALTTDACQKGLPKAQTGEVATFKGTAPFFVLALVCVYHFDLLWNDFKALFLQAGHDCCGL